MKVEKRALVSRLVIVLLGVCVWIAPASRLQADEIQVVRLKEGSDDVRTASINAMGLPSWGLPRHPDMNQETVSRFMEIVERAPFHRPSGWTCDQGGVEWYPPGYGGATPADQKISDPFGFLAAGDHISRVEVVDLLPGYDFLTSEVLTLVVAEVKENLKGGATGVGDLVVFQVPWGEYQVAGERFCVRPPKAAYVGGSAEELEFRVAEKLLVSYSKTWDLGDVEFLSVSYSAMLRIKQGVATPMPYVPTFSAGTQISVADLRTYLDSLQ